MLDQSIVRQVSLYKVVLSFSTALSCSSAHWKCESSFTRACSGAVIVDIFGMWLARKFTTAIR